MKMTKTYKHICIALGISLICGTGMVSAASGSKTIAATYRDINISYNGTPKVVTDEAGRTVEPFAVNGTVYVPLRGVSNILGVQAQWIPTTNTVSLTGAGTPDISAYAAKISELQTKLNAANAEIASLKNNGASTSTPVTPSNDTVKKLEQELYDNYSLELSGRIPFDFRLSKSSTKFYLTLTYNKSSANTAFDDCPPRSIESYLIDVCDFLHDKYPTMSIDGTIEYNGTEKYIFDYSKTGSFTGEAVVELDEDDIEDFILDHYTVLESSLVDTLTIRDAVVSVDDDNSTIDCDLFIKTHTPEDKDKWNSHESDRDLKNDLNDLMEDIQDEFDTSYDISFEISDESNDDLIARWEDDSLRFYNWD